MNILLNNIKHGVKAFPPVSWWLRRTYDRFFEEVSDSSLNLFRGVYASYGEATAHLPCSKPKSYDNAASAGMYIERTRTVYSTDYPVLYWLSQILKPGYRVFDFGGHRGVSYYAYHRYLPMHEQLHWTVCDLPAVVEEGRKLALARQASRLDFTTDFLAASGCDVMLCNGSLQYIDAPLSGLLNQLAAKPQHLIVNMLPVHAERDFYTVQNISTAYCAYHVFSADAFLKDMQSAGYQAKDSWRNSGKHCVIPYQDGYSVEDYSGFYFVRT